MSTTDAVVIAAGLAGIAWVNWYFFVAGRRPSVAARSAAGAQEITVTVQGGYEPAHIRLRRGVPARLLFDRRETSACSEELVLADFGIRRFLPPHQRTAIEFTPDRAGTFPFTCGMGMLHGQVTVEEN